MNQAFIGIDPGKSGGLAWLGNDGDVLAEPMPGTEYNIWRWFVECDPVAVEYHAVIEKAHSWTGQGVKSMFTSGMGYGGLRMALVAVGIPFEEITPQRWQKELGIVPKKKDESGPQFKLRLLAKAQQLFPRLSLWREPKSRGKQLAVADALLLAHYCRLRFGGKG